MVNNKLSELYPEPWGHFSILHPESRRSVRLMSSAACLWLAGKFLRYFRKVNADLIVVLESGVMPLARTCRLLAENAGFSLEWRFLKVSREYESLYYLDKPLCQSKSLVILDEYVDSGTTLRKALRCIKAFGYKKNPKVACYAWLTEATDLKSYLGYALYSGRGNSYWEELGAYPYENRIDLNGYFYDENDVTQGPIRMSNFKANNSDISERICEKFLLSLYHLCSAPTLLQKVRERSQLFEVHNYLEISHFMRFALYELERREDTDRALTTMLFNLWDLYGPMWSPYPDSYHLDFWRAFEGASAYLEEVPGFPKIEKKYRHIREPISNQIATCLEARRRDWDLKLQTLILNTNNKTF